MARERARFRLFAGPNGSGKSTLFTDLKKQGVIHTGIYIAADRIESDFRGSLDFNFNAYRVSVDQDEFRQHCKTSGFIDSEKFDAEILQTLNLSSGVMKFKPIHTKDEHSSYIAAMIAGYLVDKVFDSNQSFCFESVMSHPDKINYFDKADQLGYSSYLYFTTLADSAINVERVADRVKKGGHGVPKDKIVERYKRSMDNLRPAAGKADKSYIFDNTIKSRLVCSVDRVEGRLEVVDDYPEWLRPFFNPNSSTF